MIKLIDLLLKFVILVQQFNVSLALDLSCVSDPTLQDFRLALFVPFFKSLFSEPLVPLFLGHY